MNKFLRAFDAFETGYAMSVTATCTALPVWNGTQGLGVRVRGWPFLAFSVYRDPIPMCRG